MRGKGRLLAHGKSVGSRVAVGPARVIHGAEHLATFRDGEVLVAPMTDPDWEPVMKRAQAIVTDHGGRTCHAAIVSRELGLPCVVGTGTGSTQIELLTHVFDEHDPGVIELIRMVVERAHRKGRKVGLCGQAPSDDPPFAQLLAEIGLDSVSVTSDALPRVVRALANSRPAREPLSALSCSRPAAASSSG